MYFKEVNDKINKLKRDMTNFVTLSNIKFFTCCFIIPLCILRILLLYLNWAAVLGITIGAVSIALLKIYKFGIKEVKSTFDQTATDMMNNGENVKFTLPVVRDERFIRAILLDIFGHAKNYNCMIYTCKGFYNALKPLLDLNIKVFVKNYECINRLKEFLAKCHNYDVKVILSFLHHDLSIDEMHSINPDISKDDLKELKDFILKGIEEFKDLQSKSFIERKRVFKQYFGKTRIRYLKETDNAIFNMSTDEFLKFLVAIVS